MISRHSKFLFLTLGITLGGCSSFPSLPTFSKDGAEQEQVADPDKETSQNIKPGENIAQDNEGTESSHDNVTTEPTIVLSPEELEQQALEDAARQLMGTINAHKLDKQQERKLSSEQLKLVQGAMNYLMNTEPEKALIEIQKVISDPDFIVAPNSSVWVLRGDIYRALEDNEKAIQDYLQALSLSINNYQAHNRLGIIYRDKGNFDLAKKHYDQAINAWPGYAGTYRNRGILFDIYMGDKASALEDYKIYKALLDFQVQSVDTPAKALVKEQRLAKQWILDIERQIKILQREQAND